MNDIVSIRKMRRCSAEIGTGARSTAFSVAVVAGKEFVNFLRGGNPFSLSAEQRLEIDPEVGFNRDFTFAGRAVAENQVILNGMVERRRHGEVDLLIMRSIG